MAQNKAFKKGRKYLWQLGLKRPCRFQTALQILAPHWAVILCIILLKNRRAVDLESLPWVLTGISTWRTFERHIIFTCWNKSSGSFHGKLYRKSAWKLEERNLSGSRQEAIHQKVSTCRRYRTLLFETCVPSDDLEFWLTYKLIFWGKRYKFCSAKVQAWFLRITKRAWDSDEIEI